MHIFSKLSIETAGMMAVEARLLSAVSAFTAVLCSGSRLWPWRTS